MKLKETAKRNLAKAKEFVSEYKFEIIGGATLVFIGFGTYLLVKGCPKSVIDPAVKKIEAEAVKGEGPMWDALKKVFKEFGVQPGDIWMLESGSGANAGLAQLAHITGGPMEVMNFEL